LTHLGIALFNQGDKVKGEQAILMGLNKSRNDRLYLGDYGSQLRDTSVITYLLNKYSMLPKRASGLIFSLSDKLGNRDYLSTQERNALFRTGVLLQGKPQATWQGQLIVGDNEVGEPIKQTGTYRKNFQSDTIPTTIHFSSQTNAPLYMRYQRQAYPTESPATQMDLMQIERSYYNLQGQSIVLNHIQSGQVVLVHLTITAHQQRFKDALVVDLIPAGFEIENQNLEHNLKIESFKIGTLSIQQLQENSHVKYQQYLGDRYIAAMDLHKNKPQHAFYLMRAVTKGVFINPPPYAEDMYRPYMRGIGRTFNPVRIF
ncbi:MAG: hypothetical protein KAG06_07555, partial [Methylococcales bacterium]|nr:hypothetical protein [Methylococcales bacterium]